MNNIQRMTLAYNRRKLPSQWAAEGVYILERGDTYLPRMGDDFVTYTPEGGKVQAVCEYCDGSTLRFNYIKRFHDHTRVVVVLTYQIKRV